MKAELQMATQMCRSFPEDTARTLEKLPLEDSIGFFQEAPYDAMALVLPKMEMQYVKRLCDNLPIDTFSRILETISSTEIASLLRRTEDKRRQKILHELPSKLRRSVDLLLHFPEDTAGALLDPNVSAFPEDLTVRETIARMRRGHAKKREGYVFVVDRDKFFQGIIHLRDLISSPGERLLTNVMQTNVDRIPARAERSQILSHPGWRSYHALAVVDSIGRFLGIIDYATLRRLETEGRQIDESDPMEVAGSALGEVYWLGFSSLWKGFSAGRQGE